VIVLRSIGIGLLALLGLGLMIQLIPYGRAHENPDVIREPAWDRPQTRELFERACKDATAIRRRGPGTASSRPPRGWSSETSRRGDRISMSLNGAGRRTTAMRQRRCFVKVRCPRGSTCRRTRKLASPTQSGTRSLPDSSPHSGGLESTHRNEREAFAQRELPRKPGRKSPKFVAAVPSPIQARIWTLAASGGH
jgi:hypothetical protein